MRAHAVVKVLLVACLVAASITLASPSAFGQGRPPGAGGGGGGGHTESAVNNLSYPAVKLGGVSSAATPFSATLHVNGETFSYACDKPEVVGTTTYPNTSCAVATSSGVAYLTAEECTATGPCAGLTVDRVYWQKILTNDWKAEEVGAMSEQVAYLDWGDNIESKSWSSTSTIRLETVPFADYSAGGPTPAMRGYQMWHVLGQGPDEQWGVRTTDSDTPVPYVYDSPYAIIHTGNARLNIAKLYPEATACPSTGPASSGFPDTAWQPGGWDGACTLSDGGFTAELNVGGKYVYGHNWAIRRETLPPCNGTMWNKAGWWRLTFYTSDNGIQFTNSAIPLFPPTLPGAAPAALAAESETGALYAPVIDTARNLTFIDICIVASGGGGRK